jgi:hypothetical protein
MFHLFSLGSGDGQTWFKLLKQDGMGHSSELLDATKRAAPSAL